MEIPGINISGVTRPAASWQNKSNLHAKKHTLGRSKGMLITETADGTTVSANDQSDINPHFSNYVGEYNRTASYAVGDWFTVLPNVDYGVSASVGSFVTVASVPGQDLSDALITAGLDSTYPQWVRQGGGAQYFPQFPASSSIATQANPVGRYFDCVGEYSSGSMPPPSWNAPQNWNSSQSYNKFDVLFLNDGSDNSGLWFVEGPLSASIKPGPGNSFLIVYAPRPVTTCNEGTSLIHGTPPS